ncbi:hypothetical protein UFOVP116_2 [uncultured Caudovirales phage]|uniref:Uncharacterized protein n=1 Tax=uncultured Caudovirales phage TaxID=2100421 RepID=A0A6J5L528_9CAUD|nr:hypothetical protein UFOVP116_2 [uncultured Caudovirales phage]
MGRPLKLTKTVDSTLKVGVIGDTAQPGTQIQVTAFIPGGTAPVTGYIVKQIGSRRFKVTTADGTGICTLTTDAVVEGTCSITATTEAGATFSVSKITAKRVSDAGGQNQFLWTFGAAKANTIPFATVTLASA